MKKILLVLIFIPLVSFGQYDRYVTDLGVEYINYNESLKYKKDGNPFNDNEETLTLKLPSYYGRTFIKMSKSDISPLKIEFGSFKRHNRADSPYWFYEFIFDNDKNTYMMFNESSSKKIVSLDDEIFIKLKKHKKLFVRQTEMIIPKSHEYYLLGTDRVVKDYVIDLKGMTAGFNKFSGVKTPSMKNKSLYKVANGLANVNPFNLDKYIDKFILDAKTNHNIDLSYVSKKDRLILFRELEGDRIASAYKMNDDESVLVLVDPENWYEANQSKRWYIIYHELGHDILNLNHGECGPMMNERASGNYSWDRLEKDKNTMFEMFKSK